MCAHPIDLILIYQLILNIIWLHLAPDFPPSYLVSNLAVFFLCLASHRLFLHCIRGTPAVGMISSLVHLQPTTVYAKLTSERYVS